VVPARFGTLVEASALRALLVSRRAELRAALGQVRGCAQMTLRVWGDPHVGGPDRAPDSPRRSRPPGKAGGPLDCGRRGGPGTRYLLERGRGRAVGEIAPLRPALRDLVRGERVERHDRPPLLATVYHLVPLRLADTYRAAVAAAGDALRPGRVTVSGPWPAYAFAPEWLA
jgi:hypothetical protein